MIMHEVEQGAPEWHQLRAGMPTGSCAKKLVTSTGAPSKTMPEYALELAGDMYAGEPLDAWEGNQWTERGTELEDSARAMYEMITDCEVQQVGFCTDDARTFGVSPDGMVNDDGLVEFKCLKATNHIKAIMYHKKHHKAPTDYVSQIQMQLMVTGREWCDLVFYHPSLPELIIRVLPDAEFHETLKSQLDAVILERDNIIKLLQEA